MKTPPPLSTAKLSQYQYTSLDFRGELETITIQHPKFQAEILLQGAQLLSFKPVNSNDWLWKSPLENYMQGKAVRGGIPICLPWFGVNRHQQSETKHGFIRHNLCELKDVIEQENSVTLRFTYQYQPKQSKGEKSEFPSAFTMNLSIELNAQKKASIHYHFELEHHSKHEQVYSYAFHSYLSTPDLATTEVLGLEKQTYLDNTESLKRKTQTNALTFEKEVDRVFFGCKHSQILKTKQQNLIIASDNAPTCITWNPQQKLAATMPDIQKNFKDFVCIERGRAFDDEFILKEKQVHCSNMSITLSE